MIHGGIPLWILHGGCSLRVVPRLGKVDVEWTALGMSKPVASSAIAGTGKEEFLQLGKMVSFRASTKELWWWSWGTIFFGDSLKRARWGPEDFGIFRLIFLAWGTWNRIVIWRGDQRMSILCSQQITRSRHNLVLTLGELQVCHLQINQIITYSVN